MYASYLRRTYFDMPIHVFGVLCFNKTYFRIWFSWIDRIKTSLHGLMYIRFVLYTCMLHTLDKLILICIFICLEFCVLTKHIFGVNIKNIIYISFMYIGLYPYTTCFKLFKYHVFVFGWVLDKTYFQFKKIQVLENTDFDFRQNFHNTKRVQNICNLVWFLFKQVCISKIIQELIFVNF